MPRLRLASECYGIDGVDGRKYNRDRKGFVDVPDSVARHMRGTELVVVEGSVRRPSGAPEKVCGCGFVAYAWQTDCPRCGSDLSEGEMT